jgi:glutaconyl-CoA/methylmalonyl-CoA decarboxylase subunit gamma
MKLEMEVFVSGSTPLHSASLREGEQGRNLTALPSTRLRDSERSRAVNDEPKGRRTRSRHHVELEPSVGGEAGRKLAFSIDGRRLEAEVAEVAPGKFSILIAGRSFTVEARPVRQFTEAGVRPPTAGLAGGLDASSRFAVEVRGKALEIVVRDPRRRASAGERAARNHEGPQEIAAPMPGRIVKLLVAENQEVQAEEGLLIIEAMKMQNELRAPRAGRVEKIYVAEGAGVETGLKLLRLG